MKAFRRVLLVICLGATFVWAALMMVITWTQGPGRSEGLMKMMGTFAILTLASLVALGATHYARTTD